MQWRHSILTLSIFFAISIITSVWTKPKFGRRWTHYIHNSPVEFIANEHPAVVAVD